MRHWWTLVVRSGVASLAILPLAVACQTAGSRGDTADAKPSTLPLVLSQPNIREEGATPPPPPPDVSPAEDAQPFAAELALTKRYLIQAMRPDGKFTYEYDPATDLDSGDYNILRHAGTIYAMMELYEADPDPALLAAAERAIGYLLEQVKPGRFADTACVVEGGWVKLGGNALAAVALAEHARVTGERRHLKTILDLGRWIILTQESTGRFAGHKQRYPGGQRDDFVSAYYPGEAILALARIQPLDPDGPWLAKAQRGADWLIRVRDFGQTPATIPHDHWLLYGLGELYRDERDRAYVDHALLITRAILDAKVAVPPDEESPDAGAARPGRAAAVAAGVANANHIATRIEGFCAAYPLLNRAGEDAAATEVRAAVAKAAEALVELQITEEADASFPEPQRAAGGFRATSASNVIRIDTVQHSVSALLGARRLAEED